MDLVEIKDNKGPIGEYRHNVDPKGRVSMPSKFRKHLGSEFYITRGMEGCLFVYNEEQWQQLYQKIHQLKLSSKSARNFSRLFYSGAMEISLDKSGRILIPQGLRTYAEIDKNVAIIGLCDRIEIWDSEKWDEYLNADNMDYDSLMEELEEMDL